MKLKWIALAATSIAATSIAATASAQHDMHAMPDMQGMQDMDAMQPLFGPYSAMRESSGTSWVPDTSPMPGISFERGDWHWMVHGNATLVYDDQGGARGGEEWFSSNMLMLQGSRTLGPGTLGLRSMLSLEPATIDDDGYPLLFQTGETADGKTPLVDAQHPHDLFMELAASYSLATGDDSSVFVYAGLPGEPALGPPTFMHRYSAMEIPEAPLGHHWLDSTHISYGVITLGTTFGAFKLDASAFNGREPDQHRWDIETGQLDSESVRLSFNPSPDWALQVSYGNIHEPEQLEPGVDVERGTVSAIYNRAWEDNVWATTLAAGRNNQQPGDTSDAYLVESALTLDHDNTWFARGERVDKDELFTTGPLVGSSFTIWKLSLGYERELFTIDHIGIAIGGMGSLYWFDDTLDATYGSDPRSFMLFLRARL